MCNGVGITGIGFIVPEIKRDSKVICVKDELLKNNIGFNQWRKMDRFCKMGMLAADMALKDRYKEAPVDEKAAVIIGTAWGTVRSIASYAREIGEKGVDAASPNQFPLTINNCLGGFISIYKKLTGPNITFTSGNMASADALGYACSLIGNGIIKTALVGGVEEYSDERMKSFLNKSKSKVIGEGAAFAVLESMEAAHRNNINIYGEIQSYSNRSGRESQKKAIEDVLSIRCNKFDGVQEFLTDELALREGYGDIEGANTVFDVVELIKARAGDESQSQIIMYKENTRTGALMVRI